MGTEHILLALLVEDERLAGVVGAFGVTEQHVRAAIVRMMGRGVEPEVADLPFTVQAEDALELATRQASGRGRDQADAEDLLLALLEERQGAAARILLELDADPAAIRAALPS